MSAPVTEGSENKSFNIILTGNENVTDNVEGEGTTRCKHIIILLI